MPNHDYKTPGLIRAGFEYQDLVAIETLIDFYRDNTLYQWVKIDADDEEFRSIEDVVACTPEGTYDLTQVKFTADPEAAENHLSWEWLTKKKANGKSLLEKWAPTTLSHKMTGTLRKAMLKTDRIPDVEVARCLNDFKIDYDALTPDIRAVVDAQLGSAADARAFFETFEFSHSQPRIDDLEDRLWSRIASDTDRGGWAAFRLVVQRWGTLKNQPGPDGRIRYIHLRHAFSVERPRPIPQGFKVPPNYSVPDADFDADFLKEITTSDGLTVLWGPPGRGKSTYLSHCVARLDPKAVVCIRHHYFLSLDDKTESRFHYHAIARSLEHQLDEAIPDLAGSRQTIGDLINAAAARLAREGRRLVVIIDGLDHVWRENRDHEQMEELFNSLIPTAPNVRLVVGTQKIASEHLPARLVNTFPPERWRELPLMSFAAVQHWLNLQDKAGRLNLDVPQHSTRAKAMRSVAQAFFGISKGLPLHLIYSFEALARSGAPVTRDDVAALPACPTGDIRDYYRTFWERLSPRAQAILHVLAGLDFGPPPFAMADCFGLADDSMRAVTDISHLLEYRETEVRPFHGSLFVFVSDFPNHQQEFASHAPAVRHWLETKAPAYWSWAWLWITKAQLGETSDLVSGPSRQWAVDALADGFPIEQIITILNQAEKLTFGAFDLPRTLELRSLKIRALNAPEFQAYDSWHLFPEVAITLTDDAYAATILRSNMRQAPARLFPYMVRGAEKSVRTALANRAIDELNHRITYRNDQEVQTTDRQQILATAIAGVVAHLTPDDTVRLVNFAKRSSMADSLISIYIREAMLAGNLENAFRAGELWSGRDSDRDVFAALCLEGLSPEAPPKLRSKAHPATRCLALLKGENAKRSRVKRDLSRLFPGNDESGMRFYEGTRAVLYDCFFASLAVGLAGGKARDRSIIPEEAETSWLAGAVRAFEELAQAIATNWRECSIWPTIAEIYGGYTYARTYGLSHDEHRRFIAVRLALQDVAIDLALLGRALTPGYAIDASDIQAAQSSDYWLHELWLDAFCERRLPLHTEAAVQVLVARRSSELNGHITQFDERTSEAIKLALFAVDHGLVNLAEIELRRAIGCLLGYGYRKDPFGFEVLESLDLLARVDAETVKTVLLDLAGAFEAITEYTDGDETDHARVEYYELVARYLPERVPACYAHLLRNDDWRYAETLTTTLAKSESLETPAGQNLLESFLDGNERRALEGAVGPTRPVAAAANKAVGIKVGVGSNAKPKSETTEGPAVDEAAETTPSPTDYPPGRLREYLIAVGKLRNYDDRRNLAADWLLHWEKAGEAAAILADVETEVSQTRLRLDIETALDTAFEVSLRSEGRAKAFPWLVRAHVVRYGWSRWFTQRDEAERRLRTAAKQYPGRWREFIAATARSVLSRREEETGISIGLSRLVFFLIEVGEVELARAYALAMVQVLKDELSEQPIKPPGWAT